MFDEKLGRYVISNPEVYQKLLDSGSYRHFCDYPELVPFNEDTAWECVDIDTPNMHGCPYFRECPGVGFVKLNSELYEIKDGYLEKY